jgi:hypothetical protein
VTQRRLLGVMATLSVVLLGAVACSGSPDDSTGTPSSPVPTTAALPTLAGSAEAQALYRLPSGPATGSAVLTFVGVGELRSPISGNCAHGTDTTRIDGSADTAQIHLDVDPHAVRLAMQDVGFSANGDMAKGRYDVSGAHLSLDAPLVQEGQVIGSVQLEVDCGS